MVTINDSVSQFVHNYTQNHNRHRIIVTFLSLRSRFKTSKRSYINWHGKQYILGAGTLSVQEMGMNLLLIVNLLCVCHPQHHLKTQLTGFTILSNGNVLEVPWTGGISYKNSSNFSHAVLLPPQQKKISLKYYQCKTNISSNILEN